MNGKPKNHRAVCLAVMYVDHPEIDNTDGRLLSCIAENGGALGEGSHPGNVAFEKATKLKWSAVHVRLERNIKRGLIERTFTPHGRPNPDDRKASEFRICYWHPAYPDFGPTGERLSKAEKRPVGPDGLDEKRPVGPDGLGENVRLQGEKHPVSASKTSGLQGENIRSMGRSTSVSHPNPTHPTSNPGAPESGAGGWDGFVLLLPSEMHGSVARKHDRIALEKLIATHGPETVAGTVMLWIKKRSRPVDDTLTQKWWWFLREGLVYLGDGRAHFDAQKELRDHEAWLSSPEWKAANQAHMLKLAKQTADVFNSSPQRNEAPASLEGLDGDSLDDLSSALYEMCGAAFTGKDRTVLSELMEAHSAAEIKQAFADFIRPMDDFKLARAPRDFIAGGASAVLLTMKKKQVREAVKAEADKAQARYEIEITKTVPVLPEGKPINEAPANLSDLD